jgi:hypothetical protein
MRNAECGNKIRNPKSGFRNGVSGPDAENERSDKSDRTLRFGRVSSCDAAIRKNVPWVLLLRIVKTDSNKRTPRGG